MVFHPTKGYGKVIYVREGFSKIKVRFGSEEIKLDRDEVSMMPSVESGVSKLVPPKKAPAKRSEKPIPAEPILAELLKLAESEV
jgi:hypothetical protein